MLFLLLSIQTIIFINIIIIIVCHVPASRYAVSPCEIMITYSYTSYAASNSFFERIESIREESELGIGYWRQESSSLVLKSVKVNSVKFDRKETSHCEGMSVLISVVHVGVCQQ
jgi:hypothetical protein